MWVVDCCCLDAIHSSLQTLFSPRASFLQGVQYCFMVGILSRAVGRKNRRCGLWVLPSFEPFVIVKKVSSGDVPESGRTTENSMNCKIRNCLFSATDLLALLFNLFFSFFFFVIQHWICIDILSALPSSQSTKHLGHLNVLTRFQQLSTFSFPSSSFHSFPEAQRQKKLLFYLL